MCLISLVESSFFWAGDMFVYKFDLIFFLICRRYSLLTQTLLGSFLRGKNWSLNFMRVWFVWNRFWGRFWGNVPVLSKRNGILVMRLFWDFRSFIGKVGVEILSFDNIIYIIRFNFWDFAYFLNSLVGFRAVVMIRLGFRLIIGQIDELDDPIWKRYFHNGLNLG